MNKHSIFGPSHFKFGASEPLSNSQDAGSLIPKSNVTKQAVPLTNIENLTLPPPQSDNTKVHNGDANKSRSQSEQIVLSSEEQIELSLSPEGSLTGEVQAEGDVAPVSADVNKRNSAKTENPGIVKPSTPDTVPSDTNAIKVSNITPKPYPDGTDGQKPVGNEPSLIPQGQHSYPNRETPNEASSIKTIADKHEPSLGKKPASTPNEREELLELGAVGGVEMNESITNIPALSEEVKNRRKLKARRMRSNKDQTATQGNNDNSPRVEENAPSGNAGNTKGNIKVDNGTIGNLEADGANTTNENTENVQNDNELNNETRETAASNIVESESDGDTDSSDDSDEELDIEEIRKENIHLKSAKQCRVCRDNDANKLFLPCGHLACCSLCAPALQKCPQCKTVIRGIVAVFFG